MRIGDARRLDEPDASYDVVLMLGPLYHLVRRDDRLRALGEARRVVRPGGLLVVAAISRYASAFDGYLRGIVDEPVFEGVIREDLRSGQHRNPDNNPRFFTTAYFHGVEELATEVSGAGLHLNHLLPVEGMLNWAPDIEHRLADPRQRELVLEVLAAMEHDPNLTGATAHLLAVAYA
jgi:SAM-dependent methyltransferase